mmetsp:Transcript_14930/g.33210  ORF Transcript_14930/g.33210 Transcript_14930/m.33210 type:complete len:473 (-) Transcript_14930:482-1900(-)
MVYRNHRRDSYVIKCRFIFFYPALVTSSSSSSFSPPSRFQIIRLTLRCVGTPATHLPSDKLDEHTACYKPNSAFFECISPPSSGLASLGRVISHIASKHPTIPVLLDAKRGDIGSTSDAYAVAAYEVLGADGITLSPLMGADSVRPFVNRSAACTKRGGCFVLCKTSNTSSKEILGQKMEMGGTVYENITRLAVEWDDRLGKDAEEEEPHIGLVVGATDPSAVCTVAGALQKIDRGAGDGGRRSRRRPWILAPGVGAQGGDLVESVRVAMGSDGKGRILVSVSREVAHAEDPGQRAGELRKDIEAARVAAKAAVDADSTSSFLGLLPYQREFISFALAEEVLKFGSFTLKSGRTSPYFFNAGLFRTGRALSELGRAYADCVATEFFDKDGIPSFDVIFGPAYKGIGLGACVVSALWTAFGVDVGFAYNRKEAKDHGEGGVLVGSEMVGKRVLVSQFCSFFLVHFPLFYSTIL